MLKQTKPPSVFWDANGTFTDYTLSALSFGRDTFSLASLSHLTDYLYFGLYKPFHSLYLEMSTPNDTSKTLSVEYYNGSTWTTVLNLLDDTKGFSRSGFIRFDPNQADWSKTTINSVEKYWIRIRPDAAFDADCTAQGLGIVFSDDQDLVSEVPEILEYLSSDSSSFILKHEAARDDIIQEIRNKGQFKDNYTEGLSRQIEAWDLLDIEEVKQWSKYLALSKIFENISTQPEDIYWLRSERFIKKAQVSANVYYTSIDMDDDGALDIEERLGSNMKSSSLVRR